MCFSRQKFWQNEKSIFKKKKKKNVEKNLRTYLKIYIFIKETYLSALQSYKVSKFRS